MEYGAASLALRVCLLLFYSKFSCMAFCNNSSRLLLNLPVDWQPPQADQQHEEGGGDDHHHQGGGDGHPALSHLELPLGQSSRDHPARTTVQLLDGQEASFRHELYDRCMGRGQPLDVGECESWVCLLKVDFAQQFLFHCATELYQLLAFYKAPVLL
jgi:hypothetical protein